jgi:coproporphyrinogen III oxidase-like Fe-S oxidoreductase
MTTNTKLWAYAKEKQQDLKKLERFGIRRTRENYYPHVTSVLPYGLLEPVNAEEFSKKLETTEIGNATFYEGFYGCANLCNFCPFGTMIDHTAPKTFEAMKQEHKILAKHIDPTVEAFYFGGGTASLIPNKQLDLILESIHTHFDTNKTGEWKFEIYPNQYNENVLREKLAILRKYDFTDLNIDIQSSNQESLNAIGRSNSTFKHFEAAVTIAHEERFDSITTTLMAGLPHETQQSFETGLQKIVDMPEITTVIIYPVFQRGNKKIHDAKDYLSVEAKDQMTIFADNFLRNSGFFPHMDKYYLRKKPKTLSIEEKFTGATHIGMGTSARGCFRDSEGIQWHYHNTPFNTKYLDAIFNGMLPVERMSPVSREEQGYHYFLQALCSFEAVDSKIFDKQYGTNIMEELEKPLRALSNVGLIKIDKTRVTLLEPFRSEEIVGNLRDARINNEMLKSRYANNGRNLNWGIGIPEKDKKDLLAHAGH